MGKFKFSYKRFAVTVMVGAILAATTATAAFSYAWFTNHNNVTNNDLKGSTAGAYFARGDGSSTNPYVINKPIHLYNLAWLQYIGAFDGKEPYFIIEADLDMSGWTLPPIGTTEHPFKGHLDGYDKTHFQNQTSTAKISNLTISNEFGDFNRHPSSVTTFASPEITGLFGVIEEPTTKDVPSVQNLYIDNLTVTSKTDNALTGLVAGYVNGQLEGIGINNSKLDIKNGTSKLDGYDNISKYTSVGYCTKDYETSYVKTNTTMYNPAEVGTVSFNPTGSGGGSETDWGGSIDMRTLNRRLNYISAVSNPKYDKIKGTFIDSYTVPNEYNLRAYLQSSEEFYWKTSGKSLTLGIQEQTFLPLNIDKNAAFPEDAVEKTRQQEGNNTYWHYTDFYGKNSSEASITLATNTGYLVGGSESSSTWGDIRSKIQPLSSGLYRSLKNTSIDTYNPDNLIVSTIDTRTSTNTVELNASNAASFGYQKFSKVKKDFDGVMEDSSSVHGFHLMKSVNTSKPSTMALSEPVNILDTNYSEFLKGTLSFVVSNPGTITVILGSYYNSSYGSGNNQTMFDLFEIKREKGLISKVNRIEKVYNVDGNIQYSREGETVSGDLLFDFTKVTGSNAALQPTKAYYFEIPVLPGEYAIGKSKTTDSFMAYLMYLDIGANAGGTTGNKVDRTKIYEVFEQVNEEFKYPNGVEIVNFAAAGVDAKKFAVVVGASYSGKVVQLNYTGNNSASVTVTESNDTGLGYFDVGLTFTSGQKTQVGATTTHTRTQRLTYFDYYRETELGTEALFTNVLQFSQTQTMKNGTWGVWGEITRSDYQSGKGNTEFIKYNGTLTIFGDNGKTTTDLPTIEAPQSYDYSSNVFTLQTTDTTIPSIDADWIQTGVYPTDPNPTHYTFNPTGYKFTMKYMKDGTTRTDLMGTQYSATRNSSYTVSINGAALE